MHGEAVDSGALGGNSPGEAAAGRGISVRRGADILAPGNGISFLCDWIREESAAPTGESGALGNGISSRGCGFCGGEAVPMVGEPASGNGLSPCGG